MMLSARALGYWILAVLLLASPVRLLAQAPTYYDFHPRSIMSLGQGFSIENLGQARQKCVNYEEHPYETGNLGTSALIYMVSDSQQLRKALSMDSSVEV